MRAEWGAVLRALMLLTKKHAFEDAKLDAGRSGGCGRVLLEQREALALGHEQVRRGGDGVVERRRVLIRIEAAELVLEMREVLREAVVDVAVAVTRVGR